MRRKARRSKCSSQPGPMAKSSESHFANISFLSTQVHVMADMMAWEPWRGISLFQPFFAALPWVKTPSRGYEVLKLTTRVLQEMMCNGQVYPGSRRLGLRIRIAERSVVFYSCRDTMLVQDW